MIHHISVAVNNPLHVAKVLAEVWEGQFYPFSPHPGSYIIVVDDSQGTAIEVYPSGTQLTPGTHEVEFSQADIPPQFISVHAAISVPTSREKIEEIGLREGWRVVECDRGPFKVIEFWVENKFLLEFLPPDFTVQYTEFMKPKNLEEFLAKV